MSNLVVKVCQGIVRGCLETLPNNRNYLRFSGIPYAKKPINKLRFKSPQKLTKFAETELDCTTEKSDCFQKSMVSGEFIGSEDCLYLNIYVPDVESPSKLAVMVFLHGGGFSSGSSAIQFYSPEYLLMENVIVVTVNYRLHALGFLSLPSMGISGNAGLKDQQMALEWIYENISKFNGDPEQICLFGESAGAASVHFHILNSKSRKFIKSAICQSGCALVDWGLQRNPRERTKKLAKLLGCANIESDAEIYRTIMAAPLDKLVGCSFKSGSDDDKRRNLGLIFTPSLEVPSADAFMSMSPIELMKQKDIKIPIIFGTNDKDGMIQSAALKNNFESLNKDPARLIPMSINVELDSPMAKELGSKIKQFYFGKKDISMETIENHFDLMTDVHFLIPQIISTEIQAQHQAGNPIYMYEFQFDGELNLFKQLIQMAGYKGAAHADDVFYLFGQRYVEMDLPEDSEAYKMRKVMCKLWTNFAKYQNPTPDFDNPLETVWMPIKQGKTADLNCLVIDKESKMEKNLNLERINFWKSIYKMFDSKFIKPKL